MKSLFASKKPFRPSFVIHPFLFALYPVLFLYSHNISETSLSQILMPMLFSSLGALLFWLTLSLLMKSTLKAALATTILLIFFFSYGRVYDLLAGWNIVVAKHAYLFPAALLAWGYSIYFVVISRTDFKNITKILNVVAVVLLCLSLLSITFHEVRRLKPMPASDLVSQFGTDGTGAGELDAMPDIYYIILDEYAHPSTMLEYYHYDNSQFINELARKGFFVASDSRTAYPQTNCSLASSLNMEYMPPTASNDFCFSKMADNTVTHYLKSLGYTYVYSGVWFEKDEVGADLYYNFYKSSGGDTVVSEFARTLWNTTMARPFYDYVTQGIHTAHYRFSIEQQIQSLMVMPDVEGPKFVFAHIICPHAPFVFGPNGEYISPTDYYNYRDKEFYLGQYRFISDQIEAVVTALLDRSASEPIIILQSDHGLRLHEGIEIGDSEWQKILNAYYLPGDGRQVLYDSISPVNSFRVIFNHYFGTSYDLLDDPEST